MKRHEGRRGEHGRRGKKRWMRHMARRRRMMEMMMAGGFGPMGCGPGEGGWKQGPAQRPAGGRHRGGRPRGGGPGHGPGGGQGEGTHFHDRMKKADAISMLEDLVAGLKSGTLEIENGDDHVSLSPAGKMQVHVRTHQTDNAEVIGLRLKWRRKDGSKLASFKIGSGGE